MIKTKRRIGICICSLILLSFSFSSVFASEVIFNSSFSSGESLSLDGEILTFTVNPSNYDLLIVNENGDAHILNFFEEKIIGNYRFFHNGLLVVDTSISDNPFIGGPENGNSRRVKLLIETREPSLSSNWDVSDDDIFVGEEVLFSFTLYNSDGEVAEDMRFTHELPTGFRLTDISDCEFVNGSIVGLLTVESNDEVTCEYEGYFVNSFAKTSLLSKVTGETLIQNITLFPDEITLTVNDPFEFVVGSETDLNRTEPFNFSLEFENEVSSEIILRDISVYIPSQFISVERSHLQFIESQLGDSLSSIHEYDLYQKTKETMSTLGDILNLNFSLRAEAYGYVPIFYTFSYEYEDELYEYELTAEYINITPFSTLVLSPSDGLVINYTFLLSNISDTSLKTNSTKQENLFLKVTNGCSCTVENVTFVGSLFGKNIFSSLRDELSSGQTVFFSSLGQRMPFFEKTSDVSFSGLLTYQYENITYNVTVNETIVVQSAEKTTFRKTISSSAVEVSEPVNVSVFVESGFHGQNMSIYAFENKTYLEDHFIVLGPIQRTMVAVPNEEEVVYSYQLIPKQVDTQTEFTFLTNYAFEYPSLLLYNQSLFNDSFDPNNESDLAWFNEYYLDNPLFQSNGSVSETLTVNPLTSGLFVTLEIEDLNVNVGDIITLSFDIENNGTAEISDIYLSPHLSIPFQTLRGSQIFYPRLLPGEIRTVEFDYRVLFENASLFENTSLIDTSYQTSHGITINTSQIVLTDELLVNPTVGAVIPKLVLQTNNTDGSVLHSVENTGGSELVLRIYELDGTYWDKNISSNTTFIFPQNVSSSIQDVVQIIGEKEFAIYTSKTFVGSAPLVIVNETQELNRTPIREFQNKTYESQLTVSSSSDFAEKISIVSFYLAGVVIGVLLVGLLVYFFVFRKRKFKLRKPSFVGGKSQPLVTATDIKTSIDVPKLSPVVSSSIRKASVESPSPSVPSSSILPGKNTENSLSHLGDKLVKNREQLSGLRDNIVRK